MIAEDGDGLVKSPTIPLGIGDRFMQTVTRMEVRKDTGLMRGETARRMYFLRAGRGRLLTCRRKG